MLQFEYSVLLPSTSRVQSSVNISLEKLDDKGYFKGFVFFLFDWFFFFFLVLFFSYVSIFRAFCGRVAGLQLLSLMTECFVSWFLLLSLVLRDCSGYKFPDKSFFCFVFDLFSLGTLLGVAGRERFKVKCVSRDWELV